MKQGARAGLIVLGYLGALLAAAAVVAAQNMLTNAPASDTSGGMAAFGDLILFVVVFAVLALVPTAVLLLALRPYPRLWRFLGFIGAAIALTGVVAALAFGVGREAPPASLLASLAGFALLRIMLPVVFVPSLVVLGVVAPERTAKRTLLGAAAIELAVGLFGAVVWLLPLLAHP